MSNEAAHSEYIYSFLVAASSLYKHEIVILPQRPIAGLNGRGPNGSTWDLWFFVTGQGLCPPRNDRQVKTRYWLTG